MTDRFANRFAWPKLVLMCLLLSLSWQHVAAESLDRRTQKAFSRIGIGPDQAEQYSEIFEQFLKKRNSYVRRVLNRQSEGTPVKARKAANRAAKWSVKEMRKVLDEDQMKYYEEYVELANRVFVRDAGLR